MNGGDGGTAVYIALNFKVEWQNSKKAKYKRWSTSLNRKEDEMNGKVRLRLNGSWQIRYSYIQQMLWGGVGGCGSTYSKYPTCAPTRSLPGTMEE
jgi:hypothetical protein